MLAERVKNLFTIDSDVVIAALLHDVLEDCAVSYNDIKEIFGENVANIVFDVTDELGKNRKERHERTYPKTRKNPDAVIVKLADRIANVLTSQSGHPMFQKYSKEYPEFKKALYCEKPEYSKDKALWKRLDEIMHAKEIRMI